MSTAQNTEYSKIYAVFGLRRYSKSPLGVYFSDVKLVEDRLEDLWGWNRGNIKIVSGGSHGVEIIAEEWAIRRAVDFERVKPILNEGHIDPFGVRNEKIIDRCTDIIIFWDGEDTQVGRTLRASIQRGKQVIVIPVQPQE